MFSPLELSLTSKFAGEVFAIALLISASKADLQRRMVSNGYPIALALVYALSAFGQHLLMQQSLPLISIGTQFVFAISIGVFLLVVTVGLEKVQHKELFGGGDIKIVSATCLFLTVEMLMISMLTSCVLFVIGSFLKQQERKSWTSVTLPFVPFWTVGFVLSIVLQQVC